MLPNECIIIGGGQSILEGLNYPSNPGLQSLCATKFTILINYAYKDFPGTFLTFTDSRHFYYPNQDCIEKKCHPYIYEDLKKLPLIVGINQNGVEEFKLPNTILVDKKYRRDLTGGTALNILINLLKFTGNIYLLGFDWTRRTELPEKKEDYNPKSDLQIHYYNKKETNHQGCGYVGYYEKHNPNKIFEPFSKEKDVKIFNVSPKSNIDCFEKISYESMFTLLNNDNINQELLRKEIKNFLQQSL